MTVLTSLILVVAILVIAAAIAYYLQKDQPAMKDFINLNKEVESTIKKSKQDTLRTSKDITEEVLNVIEDLAKVFPPEATINLTDHKDEIVFETAKPTKKKKYYPRKPKTHL